MLLAARLLPKSAAGAFSNRADPRSCQENTIKQTIRDYFQLGPSGKSAKLLSLAVLSLFCLAIWLAPFGVRAENEKQPPIAAIAMHGTPALAQDFQSLPYANPDAPKGGGLTLGFQGTFDSLNPFNLKAGSTAQGLNGNVFETLMTRSLDEPFTLYGLIAQTIETDEARDFVTFHLNPKARFSDGKPITSDDVAFTFELLKTRGRPPQRAAYSLVKGISTPDPLTVHYDLSGINDREMPLTLALMPVLPSHQINREHFDNATLEIPLGSGPYQVTEVRPGERLTLSRDKNYWGRDLPVRRGLDNFDQIKIEYFRDANSLFEAFQAGLLDFRVETSPIRWTAAYDFPAVRQGKIIREALPQGGPKGMDGFVFNLRRELFTDIRIREALSLMFDFEWINTNLYAGLFTRSKSFFDESELSAFGHGASPEEEALLAPFKTAARADMLSGAWQPFKANGSGQDRIAPERALLLLRQAGFQLEEGQLVKQGKALTFEIMVVDRTQEKLALNYANSLARIGVKARVRLVDEVQYQRRRQKFDFDMMIGSWIASASPGNEQRGRWGSQSADQEASFNLAGAKSPAIDALIAALLFAKTQEDFIAAARAYDRVLLSGFYIVPLFYAPDLWIAYSSDLAHPTKLPLYGSPIGSATLDTFWRKPIASHID
jgi:peptide/nickel transport system substrate-binding protein